MIEFQLPDPLPEPPPQPVDPETRIADETQVEALKNDFIAQQQQVLYTAPEALFRLEGDAAISTQRATNQHLIDVQFGKQKRAIEQTQAQLEATILEWLAKPGADGQPQTERPPFAIWKQFDPEQQHGVDTVLAQNARGTSIRPVELVPDQPAGDEAVMSDASPDAIEDGQQYAQAGAGRPSRRGPGGRNLTPMEEIRAENFQRHLDAIRAIEPNNRELTYISPKGWVPSERDLARVHEELLRARQRAAETAPAPRSAIGIGKYAGESIAARSPKRDFTAEERSEINRIGSKSGCHTCGTREPGTESGNFVPDHQQPSRLNRPGEPQRLYPQCLSCSLRQGGLITRKIQKEKP